LPARKLGQATDLDHQVEDGMPLRMALPSSDGLADDPDLTEGADGMVTITLTVARATFLR